MNYYGLIALVTFLVALVFLAGGLKFFPAWGFMDKPEKYGLKRKPIPYYGGGLIFLSFLV